MEIPLLKDIIVIFGLSIAVLLLCHRIGIPSIVGFLLTGVVSGPYGFGFVGNVQNVDVLAQIGIVLLLFSIGMDFSIRSLIRLKRFFIVGGFLQVFLTLLGGLAGGLLIGRPLGESIFLGCLLSLSSTAIVLGLLEKNGEVSTPHGKVVVAISIFQDIAAVPMILLTPFFAGQAFDFSPIFVKNVVYGLLLLIGVFVCADQIVPRFLYLITRTRSRELFLLSVLVICFAVAWISSSIGLSLSIGAFLAGLTISESEYSNEAVGDILPFKDVFTSFFFVSIGMTLDWSFVFAQPLLIGALTIAIIGFKLVTAAGATLAVGMPLRTALLTGLALCQIGEFSFVLAKNGLDFGLGTVYHYQLFLAVALLSMALSPTLIEYSTTIANLLLKLPFPTRIKTGLYPVSFKEDDRKHNHVIIVGFGICGRYLARACKAGKIPYVVLEMNPETVKEEKKKGEPIYFGDGTHESVLRHMNIQHAQVLSIVISDPVAARNIIKVARQENPTVYIIIRTKYLQETKLMYGLGADEVIADDYGTSIDLFVHVMQKYLIPKEEIDNLVAGVREEGHELMHNPYKVENQSEELHVEMTDMEIKTLRVEGESSLVEKTLGQSELRKNYGATVLLIRRGGEILTNLNAESLIKENDILVLLGPKSSFSLYSTHFKKLSSTPVNIANV